MCLNRFVKLSVMANIFIVPPDMWYLLHVDIFRTKLSIIFGHADIFIFVRESVPLCKIYCIMTESTLRCAVNCDHGLGCFSSQSSINDNFFSSPQPSGPSTRYLLSVSKISSIVSRSTSPLSTVC